MQKELINQWSQLTKQNFDSLKELGEINTKLVERLSRQQLEMLSASMEATVRETQLVTQSRGYKELLDSQSGLTAEYNKKFLDIVRETTDILTEARDDLTAWIEKGVERAAQGVETTRKTFEKTVEASAAYADEAVASATRTGSRATRSAKKAAR
jgi:phasin family protein